jgi:hypothetical protein
MTEMKTLVHVHETLRQAFEKVLGLSEGEWPDGLSQDSVFAIGEAIGILSKAKALVGRDIDGRHGDEATGAIPAAVKPK